MKIAVYSRKSKWTGKGESVENQVTMCREYIERYIEGGAGAEIVVYEDEGFSGKNTRRPEFQRMMRDMDAAHFSYLVCYKLDRLGRNIADLANMMNDLEKRNISFVSIKEKFDTTTPIGKAMLYFSGVLAQMEREQIAERVRDNMLLLARDGRWLGGNTPLGFCSVKEEGKTNGGKRKACYRLREKPEEQPLVRLIFDSYLELESLNKVAGKLLIMDIRTRGGKEFTVPAIRDILMNPVYCTADEEAYRYYRSLGCQLCIEESCLDGAAGLISYAKTSSDRYKNRPASTEDWIVAKGRHRGIISGKDFVKAQKLLQKNKAGKESLGRARNPYALLSGLLYCRCGHAMRPKNYPPERVNEKGERTFAYLCPYKAQTHGVKCAVCNVHGNTLDQAVCDIILDEICKTDVLPEESLCRRDEFPILLRNLRERIRKAGCDKPNEERLLAEERDRKEEQIKRLVASIRDRQDTGAAMDYITGEINRLDDERKRMEERLQELEQRHRCIPESELRTLADSLADFRKLFDMLDIPQRRALFGNLVTKVVWDGECACIYWAGRPTENAGRPDDRQDHEK